MDTSDLKNPFAPEHVSAFMRTEAFYLAVVIFVAVMHVSSTIVRLADRHAGAAWREPINQKEFFSNYYKTVTELSQNDPSAAAFPVAVTKLNLLLPLIGALTLIILALKQKAWRTDSLTGNQRAEESPPGWGLWDVAKLAAFYAAGGLVMHAIFDSHNDAPLFTLRSCVAHIFSLVLMIGVMFHIVLSERGGRLADLGIHTRGLARAVAMGLIGFLAVQPFLFVIERLQWHLLPMIPMHDALQSMIRVRSPATLLMAIGIAGLIVPVAEELLFRGFLQSAFRRWVSPTMSVVLSAAFFAAAHIDLYTLLPLFALGLVLGYVYRRSRSIVAPIVLHVAFNMLTLLTMCTVRYVHAIT